MAVTDPGQKNPAGRPKGGAGTLDPISASGRKMLQGYATTFREVLRPALGQFSETPPTVQWGTPEMVSVTNLESKLSGQCLCLATSFSKGLAGTAAVCFPIESAVFLLKVIGVGGDEIDETQQQVIADTIGLTLEQAHDRLSKEWGKSIESSPLQPSLGLMGSSPFVEGLGGETEIIVLGFNVVGLGEADIGFSLLFSIRMFESMGKAIPGGEGTMDDTLAHISVARPAEFDTLSPMSAQEEPRNLGLLMDIPLEVRVELGRTTMRIHDVLELGNGSVVELERLAGEPVDLMINGNLFARGEVVVIDENFGIRITDIVNIADRLEALKKGQ